MKTFTDSPKGEKMQFILHKTRNVQIFSKAKSIFIVFFVCSVFLLARKFVPMSCSSTSQPLQFKSLFASRWGLAAERDKNLWVQPSKFTCSRCRSPELCLDSPPHHKIFSNISCKLEPHTKRPKWGSRSDKDPSQQFSWIQLRSTCNALEHGSPTRHLEGFNSKSPHSFLLTYVMSLLVTYF